MFNFRFYEISLVENPIFKILMPNNILIMLFREHTEIFQLLQVSFVVLYEILFF